MSADLQAENEQLRASNDNLARQLAGMSAKLEEGRRELLATGWDAAVEACLEVADFIGPKPENPYRKPVIDLSGAMFCKLGDDI